MTFSPGGRTAGSLRYIGVEIGGTKQQIATGAADGTIEKRRSVKLAAQTTAEGILGWIFETIRAILAQEPIAGIGVGFGGPVDPADGRVLCSFQVDGWNGFALKEWFEAKFQLPAAVRNDTVTGTMGELYLGAGQGSRRLFYTNIGTGIGGGLYDGSDFHACSLGYTWIPDWTSADPGAMTRLEFLCAGPHIEKRLNMPGYVPAESVLATGVGCLTCADLAKGVLLADPFCRDELDRIAGSFSIGLANMLALTSPDRIVIGGGVAKMGDILFSRIRTFTKKYAFPTDVGRYEIYESGLQDDSVLSGALLLAGKLTM